MYSSLSDSTGPIEEDERSRNRYGSLVVAEEAIEVRKRSVHVLKFVGVFHTFHLL